MELCVGRVAQQSGLGTGQLDRVLLVLLNVPHSPVGVNCEDEPLLLK